MIQKYKGLWNSGSQMSASFTSTGRHIISVGEDTRVYVWNYDYYHPSASKPPKSIDSCKHFFAEGVSVALPWSGRLADHNNELLPSQQQQQQQRVAEMRGAEGFSLGSWLSMDNQCCNGRVATWPEEQLPLYEALVNRQQDCRCLENGKSKCAVCSKMWNAGHCDRRPGWKHQDISQFRTSSEALSFTFLYRGRN